MIDKNTQLGVVFNISSYASFLRRLLADAIDITVLVILYITLMVIASEDWWKLCMLIWSGLSFVYLVIIKISPLRTIGYRLTGLRLIDLKGNRVSIWRSIVRISFVFLGPLNCGLDLLWIPGDPSKQAIRDKFAGTLVIKNMAKPVDKGKIIYRRYFFMGWSVVFSEVQPLLKH
jgi:uncharacterized RDD family membrane protein YckC